MNHQLITVVNTYRKDCQGKILQFCSHSDRLCGLQDTFVWFEIASTVRRQWEKEMTQRLNLHLCETHCTVEPAFLIYCQVCQEEAARGY